MERKGYDENFVKDKMATVEQIVLANKRHEYKEAYSERMAKLPMNVIELLVGVGLLIFCYTYLQSHPAEKSSLFSGIEVIVQKAKVLTSKITGGDGTKLTQKYNLERTYKEIITLGSQGKCLTDIELENATKAYDRLKTMTVDEYIPQEKAFASVASIYFDKVTEACSTH